MSGSSRAAVKHQLRVLRGCETARSRGTSIGGKEEMFLPLEPEIECVPRSLSSLSLKKVRN